MAAPRKFVAGLRSCGEDDSISGIIPAVSVSDCRSGIAIRTRGRGQPHAARPTCVGPHLRRTAACGIRGFMGSEHQKRSDPDDGPTDLELDHAAFPDCDVDVGSRLICRAELGIDVPGAERCAGARAPADPNAHALPGQSGSNRDSTRIDTGRSTRVRRNRVAVRAGQLRFRTGLRR